MPIVESLGFGFAAIGSVSAQPSVGNRRPRLFRLPEEQAIIVNDGLPNDGAEVVAKHIARNRRSRPLGINFVKTNDGLASKQCTRWASYQAAQASDWGK